MSLSKKSASDGTPRLPYWPAALNKKMAAAYCGLSPEVFTSVCPLKPISFTSSSRGERFLRQRLDEWLLSLDPNVEPAAERRSMVQLIDGDQEPKRRFGDNILAEPLPRKRRKRET
ncbi:hypothetical protein M0654_03885 [Rhizobium sp. NTR19]|uniref:DNA-binding protein n=1 Tax=Neorhizobium turbinariae TaxID=2937795 RepID=A0ABT0IML0_9HYPH|nr:hypothetical protein [Neorhizobium turbinariae]MCK8779120.1 hypothetical protein [Neorhizobium turbinariae]